MPHRLTKVCGDDQEGTVGASLTAPLVVSVSDEDGAAMAGVIVSFAVTAGGGTLSAATATTDANGRAATSLSLGSEAGTNTISATVEGLASVTFTATGQEDPLVNLFDLFGSGKLAARPDRTQLLQKRTQSVQQRDRCFVLPAGTGAGAFRSVRTEADSEWRFSTKGCSRPATTGCIGTVGTPQVAP